MSDQCSNEVDGLEVEMLEAVKLLDGARSYLDAVGRFQQTQNDRAAIARKIAGLRVDIGRYVVSQANERMPPVLPDPPDNVGHHHRHGG